VYVTTHLRARAAQAGALLAVVVGGIAVAPAVALADAPDVQITSIATDVVSGGSVTMQYQVRNANLDGQQVTITTTVTSGMQNCSGACGQVDQIDGNGKSYTAKFTAPTVAAGQTKSVQVTVSASAKGDNSGPGQDTQTVTVKGPDKPQNVTSISGKVKDQNGKAIAGASVAMKDSAGNPYSTTTNGSGGYSFNSSDSKPIAPGNISVGALKDGYDTATVQIQAAAGKSVTVPLTLKAVETTASASPSASVSASASAEASEAAEEPTEQDSLQADTDTKNAAGDQGGGSGSTLFIVLGGLLVAAGVGAIVLVMMRRKNNGGDNGPDDDPTAMGGGPGGVPPSQGRFNDATRVASPMGAGRDATMVAPRAASSPMADAPTMLQRPVEDEFPDPYGVPVPQQGGYAGGGGNWDDQAAVNEYGGAQQYGGGQYAEPTHYGQPQENDGYGAAPVGATGTYGGGQYGAPAPQPRYDEPTGMYQPAAGQDDGYAEYDQRGGAYGSTQYGGAAGNGYDDQGGAYPGGGYAGGQEQGGAYGGGQQYGAPQPAAGGAYGAQPGGGTYGSAAPAGGGTYGGQQYGGGYDQGGYDQGEYDQRGYGGGAGQEQGGQQYGGGYDDRGGYDPNGYDQRGGRQGGQYRQEEPSHPGQRRSADWDN
jgi:hypothetical protein